MSCKIAAITIGQSPRTDMVEDMFPIFPEDLSIVEYGALDPYNIEQVKMQFSPVKSDGVLISRMRDGTQVKLSEHLVADLVQQTISRAEADGCHAVMLLCTGDFPKFSHEKILLQPLPILHATASILACGKKVAVMVPDKGQIPDAELRWSNSVSETVIVAASPYQAGNGIEEAATFLKGCGAALLVMDCMGYTQDMKRKAASCSGLPVLLPRTLMAAVAAQFLSLEG